MALVRFRNDLFDPTGEFERLQGEINRLFDLNRTPDTQGLFDRSVSPAVDVLETPDEFTVLCDLPGVSMGDIDMTLAQDVLTLKGEKKEPLEGKESKRTFRKETWAGNFQRTLSFRTPIDPEKVRAVLSDGVLRVTLPKREEVKPKQIEIKAK